MAEWLTPDEVADELRVTRRMIYDLLRSGELKGAKVGRVWRISRVDLEAYLDSNGRNGDDEEELSPEDWAAVKRGLEDVKAGRYVTLEEYEAGKRP